MSSIAEYETVRSLEPFLAYRRTTKILSTDRILTNIVS